MSEPAKKLDDRMTLDEVLHQRRCELRKARREHLGILVVVPIVDDLLVEGGVEEMSAHHAKAHVQCGHRRRARVFCRVPQPIRIDRHVRDHRQRSNPRGITDVARRLHVAAFNYHLNRLSRHAPRSMCVAAKACVLQCFLLCPAHRRNRGLLRFGRTFVLIRKRSLPFVRERCPCSCGKLPCATSPAWTATRPVVNRSLNRQPCGSAFARLSSARPKAWTSPALVNAYTPLGTTIGDA